MNEELNNIMNNFFGKQKENDKILYTDENIKDKLPDINKQTHDNRNNLPAHYTANGNIDNIDDFADLIRKIIELTDNDITFISQYDFLQLKDFSYPIITYDVNSRDKSVYTGIKPHTEKFNVVNDNNEHCTKYNIMYEYNIEFDIYGATDKQANEVMSYFEKLLTVYTGYLKSVGVSEFFFLKQIPSKASVNYTKDIPMKSIIWYLRLEKIWLIEESKLKSIYVELNKFLSSKIE